MNRNKLQAFVELEVFGPRVSLFPLPVISPIIPNVRTMKAKSIVLFLVSLFGCGPQTEKPSGTPTPESYINAWESVFFGENKQWVLFKNGTVVFITPPVEAPKETAIELLKDQGIIGPGSAFGDFGVNQLDNNDYLVTSHHPDILNYVFKSQVKEPGPHNINVGLLGRSNRGKDAEGLVVLHVGTL